MENEGVVLKVVESEWAAPIVPMMKADGSVRLCEDYKVSVNQAIILASLAGCQSFSKLDLARAY